MSARHSPPRTQRFEGLRGWRSAAAAVAALLTATTALAGGRPLPEGLTAQFSALVVLARLALGVLAATLLIAGRTLPRLTIGSFFLPISLAIAWGLFAPLSYLLVIATALAIFAVTTALWLFLPRVGTALACVWIGPALLIGYQFSRGDFAHHYPMLVVLALGGMILGGGAPRFALAVLAPALGTLALAVAWTGGLSFVPLVGVFLVAVLWQGGALIALVPHPHEWPMAQSERNRARRQQLRVVLLGAAVVLAALLLVPALIAPQPTDRDPVHKRRAAALFRAPGSRPGFVLGVSNNFYLSGQPLAIALGGPWTGILNRFGVIALGHSLRGKLTDMRAVKDADELVAMRRAAAITSKAFEAVAPMVKPGTKEREIADVILDTFRKEGADGIAFPCIVGSGANATLPHYERNDAVLKDGLVVIDIGCTFDHYASDMTRTFPVRGTWTAEQRRLLDAVLDAKEKARTALKPGALFRTVNEIAHESIKQAGFGEYFTHSVGHNVGLDVHDPSTGRELKPGMVVTIEPGIYIQAGAKIDKAYWDLGIRVEDTYLITDTGFEPLTHYSEAPFVDQPPATKAGPVTR